MKSGNPAPHAPCLLRIKVLVSLGKQCLDSLAATPINRNANARGKSGFFFVLSHHFADAIGNTMCFHFLRFRQNESELVAAVACRGVDCAAIDAENRGQAAKRAAADQMAELVIDFFQAVEIEQQNRKGPAGAVSTLGLILQNIEKVAIVCEAREGIADREMANLLEEPGVIEERPA